MICRECLQGFRRDPGALRCWSCLASYSRVQALAHARVKARIRSGHIWPAKLYDCVDCGKRARDYDHRDYRKPLEVEPVCHSCNLKRGPALWHDEHVTASGPRGPAQSQSS